MKKFLFLLIVLSGAAISVFAQDVTQGINKISVGVDIGIPTGVASSVYTLGAGFSAKYDFAISKHIALTGSAGYTAMLVESSLTGQGAQSAFSYVPVKGGVKYSFAKAFYAEAQAGTTFFVSGSGTLFLVAGGVGYNFSDNVDIGVRYESWTNVGSVNQVAVRLAYSF